MSEKTNNPTVSVIIPTYNRAKFLPRAVNSVLNQTFKDFELIIVDDASTDNTEEVVKTFKDSRIKYVKHRINKGGAAARNTGIKTSRGEYVAFLDDDDEWFKDKLEMQVKKFKDSSENVGLIYAHLYWVDQSSKEILVRNTPTLKGNVYKESLAGCICTPSVALIKREVFVKSGLFDETLPSGQDGDMWIRISKFYEFDYVPKFLANRYVHGKQIQANIDAKIKAYNVMFKKYKRDYLQHPRILSMSMHALGKLYCLNNDVKNAIRCLFRSILYNPLQKRSYIDIILILFLKDKYRRVQQRKIIELNITLNSHHGTEND